MTSTEKALICTLASDPQLDETPVEVVERKGLGHPDTMCDALAEEISAVRSRKNLAHTSCVT